MGLRVNLEDVGAWGAGEGGRLILAEGRGSRTRVISRERAVRESRVSKDDNGHGHHCHLQHNNDRNDRRSLAAAKALCEWGGKGKRKTLRPYPMVPTINSIVVCVQPPSS